MPPNSLLIVTLGGSYQAAITAIKDKSPGYIWYICTQQSVGNIGILEAELAETGFPVPKRYKAGQTLTVHDEFASIYSDILPLFKELKDASMAIFLDLTSGTVPMSLASWEASKLLTEVIVSWIDNTRPPTIHILKPN
jgi:hypothetical protein